MKGFTRRDFLKFGGAAAGVAATTTLPLLAQRLPLAGPGSEFFTIGVIPDTQFYNDNTVPQPLNLEIFLDQTKYLAAKRQELNLRFVTHVGDMVEHGDGLYGLDGVVGAALNYPVQSIEWQNATKAMDVLDAAGIPFAIAIGNHDYNNMYYSSPNTYPPLVSTPSWWKNYFGSGSKYFRGKPWYGGASDEVGYISTGAGLSGSGEYPPAGTLCNYGLSSYQFFSGGGKQFLHIALELEPGDDAIAWAQKVLDSHPDLATIVTTHSYISPPAWGDNNPPQPGYMNDPAAYNAAQWMTGSPLGAPNAAQSIWTKLIAPNNQIFMVLCGHSWTAISTLANKDVLDQNGNPVAGVSKGENLRININNYGNPVYQVLTDYQGNILLGSGSLASGGGGDGWYRFMQFDMENNKIHFYTVNAWETINTGRQVLAGQTVLYSDSLSDFAQPQGFSDFSLAMPVQVLKAPNARGFRAAFI